MPITLRKIERNDIPQFLGLMNYLGDTTKLSKEDGEHMLATQLETYTDRKQIWVALDWCSIVGTATLLLESKFIHNGGVVAHIEDVVVHPDWREKGIGKKLVEKMIEIAKQYWIQPYKIILDCKMDNIPFYEKCGFRPYEISMRMDLKESEGA